MTTRGACAPSSDGSNSPVSRKGPKTFVANYISKPSALTFRLAGAMTPALLTRVSKGRSSASCCAANFRTDCKLERSRTAVFNSASGSTARIRVTASSAFFCVRAGIVTSAPASANSSAVR